MQTAVALVVGLLARRQYDVLERMTAGRLSALELERAVAGYGRTIIPLPPEALDGLDPIEEAGSNPQVFHLDVDLWTAEEGRSDLTLSLALTDRYAGAYEIAILDLHIL